MSEHRQVRPTIRDVAGAAGVSIGTVSRVLNRHPNVHERTRAHVLQTMRELGYQPVFAAQELGRGMRPTIGLNTSLGTRRLVPFFQVFLEQLTASVSNEGFRFTEIPTGSDGLPEHFADGLVLFGVHDDDSRISYLEDQSVPFVLIGRSPRCNSVASDDYTGGRMAAEHLIRLEHRTIAILTGELQGQASRDRLLGTREALAAASIECPPQMILHTSFDSLGGYRAIRSALDRNLDFTAIIAASDELALGAKTACLDAGLRVPENVSIIGYDDLPEIGEGLTTIRQDFTALTMTAVQLLRRAMAGEPPEQVLVPVRLITRLSTSQREQL